MAESHTNRGRVITDAELIDAVTDLYEAGVRDHLNGGAKREAVAERVDASTTTVKIRLRDLAEDGRLVALDGMSPESKQIRKSYRPPQDGDDDDSGRGGFR
jgi:hypothetical protein